MATLERTTFETSRELEFFTEKELQMQIGHSRGFWPIAVLRELIDNALDACEEARVAPEVTVTVGPDCFSVTDNGAGLPDAVIRGSLDYLKRVSSKAFYVSPTRGQMGNALKVVWAAPFVFTGEQGCVEVWSQGKHHTVTVEVDRLRQVPAIAHTVEEGLVRTGTCVKVHWPDVKLLCWSALTKPVRRAAADAVVAREWLCCLQRARDLPPGGVDLPRHCPGVAQVVCE